MITVALDLSCTICGHSRFTLPVGQDDGDSVHCSTLPAPSAAPICDAN